MAPPLAIGTVILDRYQVVAPLASGDEASTVALALDRNLGWRVTLVVAPDTVGTPAGDVCARRAQAIAVLQHPALPLVLDMGLQDQRVVLVYRHTEGRSLAEAVAWEVCEAEAGEGTDVRALQLIANLAAALGLAHARGLCHGSFDARSVLVERGGMATIRDLVWPRPVTTVDVADLAPEVRRGQKPDPRADVFALGHLLRRLLPAGRSWSTDGLSAAVRDVVQRAVAEDPRDRYADGAEVARAIGWLLSGSHRTEVFAPARHPRPRSAPPYPLTRATAAPVAYRPAAVGPKQHSDGLLPIVLGLTVALSLIAGAVGHHHTGDGWRGGWRSGEWVFGDGGGVHGMGRSWGPEPGDGVGPHDGPSP